VEGDQCDCRCAARTTTALPACRTPYDTCKGPIVPSLSLSTSSPLPRPTSIPKRGTSTINRVSKMRRIYASSASTGFSLKNRTV